jgi:uncharacterized protein (TIGR02271 family)
MTDEKEPRLGLVEERISIDKERVLDGRVRVTTETDIVTEIANLDLTSETVKVTRVPFGTPVQAVPPVRTEGNVTIIPVLEERMVVEKRLFLVEEIHVEREMGIEKIEVPVELRKQSANIVRIETDET